MDLFEQESKDRRAGARPLADRMRPASLAEVAGQQHILAPGKLLRRAIEADRLSSIILYGPPGCGKTTLARVIAEETDRRFDSTSGVLANVQVLREKLQAAQQMLNMNGKRTILFIDEIHRFNKGQQDVLLPYVEDGSITLIGATTHNPFFYIIAPLTSRSQVFELEPISTEDIARLVQRACEQDEQLSALRPTITDEAMQHLADICDGDARRALNALEVAVLTTPPDADGRVTIDRAVIEESVQRKAVVYDRDESGHHDTISAFIKSVRGSDPNAAVYWLAKMLHAGEDPRFIARRLVILASEDIGNADPRALTLATSAMQAAEWIGMPEARIILAQAVTYLACCPKSNAAYLAVDQALEDVRSGRTLPVPKPLRGTGYKGSDRLGHSGYMYAHNGEGHIVKQEYAPTETTYYEPTNQGYEATISKRLAAWRELLEGRENNA